MKKALQWLDENLEEVLLVIALAAMAVIMGIQVIARYIFGASHSWSEEDRAVCGDVPKEGKSHFQRSESYI